jgi:hypothetical protein
LQKALADRVDEEKTGAAFRPEFQFTNRCGARGLKSSQVDEEIEAKRRGHLHPVEEVRLAVLGVEGLQETETRKFAVTSAMAPEQQQRNRGFARGGEVTLEMMSAARPR